MKHLSEEQLVSFYYRDSDGDLPGEVQAHLDACPSCRAEFDLLQRTLDMVSEAPVPAREADYGTDVWFQLKPHLASPAGASRPKTSWFASLGWMRWATVGGLAMALIAAAFWAGRLSLPPPSTPSEEPVVAAADKALPATVRERVLLKEIGDHLERSQMALIELINARTNGPVDISAEQDLARQLVSVSRLYRQTAARAGEPGMALVLEDVERMLVEIANGPTELSSAEFAEYRQRIDFNDLLFKVKVVGSQLREKEKTMAREQASQHTTS